MNPNILILIFKGLVILALTTAVLAAARRSFGERGYSIPSAFLSVAWWGGLDLGLALLSFYLTATTYKNWFPSEPLGDQPVFGRWFTSSQLDIADMMAFVITGIVIGLAHKVAYSGMFLRQELSDNGFGNRRALIGEATGLVACGGLYLFLMYQWEAPILALRTAELIGSDALMEDAAAIRGVGEIISGSWLLRTLVVLWPLLILFMAWATTRALVRWDNVLNQQDAPEAAEAAVPEVESHGAPASEGDAQPDLFSSGDPDLNRLRAQTADAERRAQEAVRQAAEAESRAARAREAAVLTGAGNGNGHTAAPANAVHAPTGNGNQDAVVQALIDQIEEQRQHSQQLGRELDARSMDLARNPLSQPNRSGLGDRWLGGSRITGGEDDV